MASSKTGQLNQAFLGNANTVPNTDGHSHNRGSNRQAAKKIGNGKQRAFLSIRTVDRDSTVAWVPSGVARSSGRNLRTPKGAVVHNVVATGTPVTSQSPAFVQSTEKSRGRRLESPGRS